jgi:hypothetical protein
LLKIPTLLSLSNISGFMYNSLYRTEIENPDSRKFLDTFMGPNSIASAASPAVASFAIISSAFILPLYLRVNVSSFLAPIVVLERLGGFFRVFVRPGR